MKKIITLVLASILFLCTTEKAFAQPANDDCLGATTITPDGSCIAGTTVAAADNWTGAVGCQSGGNVNAHNDVWYTFVSTGTSYTGTVTSSAPFAGNVEFTLVSSTGGCGGTMTIVGSSCGVSPLSITINGLTNGATYYFTVSNQGNGTAGPFSVCSTTSTPPANCTDNDDCLTPQIIAYAAGVQTCLNDCNTGALPGPDFAGTNCFDFPNSTVWYQVTTGATSATLDIALTSAALTNPYFTVFTTPDCNTYTSVNCTQGAAGSASATVPVAINTTYLIAISDQAGATGNFDLCITVNNDNSACNTTNSLTVSATSMGSPLTGPFKPGEIVTFCYSITNWQSINCNYLQGIVPTFGDCWDPVSMDANGQPLSIPTPLVTAGVIQTANPNPGTNACAGTPDGAWSWFPAGAVTYNAIGGSLPDNSPMPAGWYFLSSYSPATGLCTGDPTDPDNSYGDSNYPQCGTNTLDWNVCFSLQAKGAIACTNGQTDCSVKVNTYADGEIGFWANVGCTADATGAAFVAANLCCTAAPTVSSPVTYCVNDVASQLTATGSGLLWYTTATGGVGSATAPTPSTTTAGSTSYWVSSLIGGCESARVIITVTVNSLPTITGTLTVCAGLTTQLTGSAPTAGGSWSSASTGIATVNASGLVTGVSAGTSIITYTNGNGCIKTATVTVNSLPTITGTLTVCAGLTTQLTGSAPTAGGSWSSASTGIATVNASGLVTGVSAGTSIITYTNGNGCVITATVTVNSLPTISGTLTVCTGLTTQLTGSAPTAGGSWSSASTGIATVDASGLVTGVSAGTSIITYTNGNGCVITATVTVNSLPTITGTLTVCAGLTTQLTGSAPTAGGSWSSASTGIATVNGSGLVTGVSAGTSIITYTNGNGCVITATVTVNSLPTITGTLTVCAGLTTQLTGSAPTAGGSWSSASTGIATVNGSGLVTGVSAGTSIITYTNGNGCVITATVTVNASPTITGTLTVCTGLTTQLTGSAPTAGGSWSSASTGIATVDASGLVTGVSAGTSIITYTNGNGCVITATVTVNSLPTITGTLTVCAGLTTQLTGSAPTAGGSWSSASTGIATVDASGLVTGVSAGTSIITYTNGNGCVITATVTVNSLPTITGTLTVCAGFTTQLTGSAPTAGGSWSSASTGIATVNGSGLVTGVSSGTSIITYTNGNGCVITATVTVNPLPVISGTATITLASCGTPDGTITGLSATGLGTLTYTWSNTVPVVVSTSTVTGDLTGQPAGSYTLVVTTDANSCSTSAGPFAIGNVGAPAAPTAGSTTPICEGSQLDLTSNTVGGATYSWTGPNGFTSSAEDTTVSTTATLAMAGTYSVTVTVAGCTSLPGTTTVVVNAIPLAPVAGNNSPICEGSQLDLTANTIAGATYNWVGPNGFTSSAEDTTVSANATVAMTGTYSVTATVAGCTSLPGTTSVSVNPIPGAPIAGSNSPICIGSQLDLTSNTIAGATYSWTGPNGFTSSAEDTTVSTNATIAMVGTYSVTVTVAGCTSLAGTTVVTSTIPTAPVAGSNSPVCEGSQLDLTSNTIAGATYSWTGPNGFTSSAEDTTVSINSTLAMAGTYSVTSTVSGCTSLPGTVTVTINSIPATPTAGSNSPVCVGSQLDLTSNTIAGATYSWTGPNGFTSSAEDTTVNASATVAMAGTYSVTATVAGCTSLAGTTTVVVNTIPATPTAGSNSPVCVGSQLDLTSNTIAGATYSWTGPNSFVSAAEDPTVSSNATIAMAGTYSVTATVAGCTSLAGTTTVVVNTIPATPTAGSNSPVCVGSQLDLTSNTIAGATYSWTGPNSFASGIEDPTVSANATTAMAGTYSVTATVAGCTSLPGTTIVVVNPIPAAPTAGSNSPVCVGSQLGLTSNTTAGASYSWTGPNTYTSSTEDPIVSSNATTAIAGTYSVTVTVSGCTSLPGTTTVIVNSLPATPTAGNNSPICAGSQLDLTSNTIAGATYSWTGPNGFVSTAEDTTVSSNATIAMSGTYSVTVTVGGCTSMPGTTVVSVNPAPVASFTTSPDPATGPEPLVVGFTNTSQNANTYSWVFGNSSTSASQSPPNQTYSIGTYTVVLTASDNTTSCTSTASAIVIVYENYSMLIPNVFTPNGDGDNDVFKVISTGVESLSGAIYDRWGAKIFQWNGVSGGWDGRTTAGMTSSDGTYYYILTVKAQDDTEHIYNGYLQLIR